MVHPQFEFSIQNKKLVLECSHFGKEVVTLDGQLVSKFTKAQLDEKNKISSIVLLIFCSFLGAAIPKMGSWVWSSPVLFILCVFVAMSSREHIYNVQIKIHNKYIKNRRQKMWLDSLPLAFYVDVMRNQESQA